MKGMMAALQFLTILPIGSGTGEDAFKRAPLYFPPAGILIGTIIAAVYTLVSLTFDDRTVTAVLTVVSLAALTGGIHLDGLADTIDALSSGKSRDEMLRIARDPHIGTMGVLALVSVFVLKVALLSALSQGAAIVALIMAGMIARYALVLNMFLFPYARSQGKAQAFIESTGPAVFVPATLTTLALSFVFLHAAGIGVLAISALFAFLYGRFFANRIGGITGDTLGAVNELTELTVLICLLVMTGGH